MVIARALMTDPEMLLLDSRRGSGPGRPGKLVARLSDLAKDADAPAIVLITHRRGIRGLHPALLLSEGGCGRDGSAAGGGDEQEPVDGLPAADHPDQVRCPVLRPAQAGGRGGHRRT